MAQVARDLGIDDNLVSRWKKEAHENGQRALTGQGNPQDAELARLRREVAVLRQEQEILKSHQHLLGCGPVTSKSLMSKMRYHFSQEHHG